MPAERISVVIAWVNDFDLLAPGLVALAKQRDAGLHEILVATRHGLDQQARLRQGFPEVTVISAPPSTTIPALRAMAIRRAAGDVIAVTEDHCVPDDGWIAVIARQMQTGRDVVGGPVENAWYGRLRDWAAFLLEYAGAIGPAPDGPTRGLPGNNVAYHRDLALELCRTLDEQRWESFFHDDLVRRGVTLHYDSQLRMLHRRPFDFLYFIGQRFHYCRSFAAMRRCGVAVPVRQGSSSPELSEPSMGWKCFVYAGGCVILPALLWLRTLRTLVAKRRFVGRYLLCTPLITIYLLAGAFGEMIGYLFGGNRSLERVE